MGFIGKQPSKTAITSSDITDGVVTADKLASDSVTTAKIADNGVTTAKINADAVTDAKIADDVVGSEHLTAGEVDTTALGADAVTAAKIADDAISEEHLDATVITGMTELAAEPADTDEFLISDAGTLKRIDYSHIKGGGMMTLVTRTAITSDVASVAFTNLEANNFHKFIFQGIDSTANSGEDLACQVSTDNGSSYITSSNYNWVYWQYYSTGSNNTTGANGSNAIYLADGFHTSGAEDALHGELNIFNVGNGQRFTTYGQSSHRADSSNKRRGTVNAGELEQDATVNAIKFFFDSGNITGSSYAFITHYKGVIA